jgi:hypothetical protein
MVEQPAHWNYDFDPSGNARATYPGNVLFGGEATNSFKIIQPTGLPDDGPFLTGLYGAPVLLSGGTFLIMSPTLISSHVTVAGASFLFGPLGTLQFAHGLDALPLPLFYLQSGGFVGSGIVTFNIQFQEFGYPEWWGSVNYLSNTPGPFVPIDSAPGINACLASIAECRLHGGVYYISSTVFVANRCSTLRGLGGPTQQPTGAITPAALSPAATQIVITSPSLTGLICGVNQASPYPGAAVAEFITLKDFALIRATATNPLNVTGAAPINNTTNGGPGAFGIRYMWCNLLRVENVLVAESSIDHYLYGCVECYFDRVSGLRYTQGAAPASDNFSAFYLDFSAPLGDNAGNASIYFNRCRAFSSPASWTPNYSAMFTTGQGFVDTYLMQCESGGLQYGADLVGNGQTPATEPFATEDFHISFCIFDTCSKRGVRITQGGNYSSVTIEGGYIGVSNNSAAAGIEVNTYSGSLTVNHMQMINGLGGQASGIIATGNATGSVKLTFIGNILTDIATPYIFNTIIGAYVNDIVNAVTVFTGGPIVPAVQCTNVNRSKFDLKVGSNPIIAAYNFGLAFDTTSQNNEVNLTRITGGVLAGAAKANAIAYNGAAWGGGSTFGTGNIATGVLT